MKPLGDALTTVALATATVTLLITGSWRTALRVLLDLLTAAGLIRLAAVQGWTDLAGAAVIIALRQLVSAALLGAGRRPSNRAARPVVTGWLGAAVRPGRWRTAWSLWRARRHRPGA